MSPIQKRKYTIKCSECKWQDIFEARDDKDLDKVLIHEGWGIGVPIRVLLCPMCMDELDAQAE